jgi:tRNA uridine 5-carboxymethylaminomethyl modification enzyme
MPTKGVKEMLKERLGIDGIKNPVTLEELLKRPGVNMAQLVSIEERLKGIKEEIAYQVEMDVKYHGYIERQYDMVKRARRIEEVKIPSEITYKEVSGLSREVIEKLERIRPLTLGQASRIPGVTPAAITALLISLKKQGVI